MENWIPFADGRYMAERAFLLSSSNSAVELDDTVIEVNSNPAGLRHLRGRGRIRNMLMVALLEDTDELDLVLDFGDEFKYRLNAPDLQGGKVFAANVESMLQFFPKDSWVQLPQAEYDGIVGQAKFIED